LDWQNLGHDDGRVTDRRLDFISSVHGSMTVVCGASGTGRTRFAYTLAAHRLNGHVIHTRDVLAPAVHAVMRQQPGIEIENYNHPHTVVTGRHATPDLAGGLYAVVLLEDEEQILANLTAKHPHDLSLDLRCRTSMLVQRELCRRKNEEGGSRTVFIKARPWSDAVERAISAIGDYWDMDNALG
jgi:hypothetical protein